MKLLCVLCAHTGEGTLEVWQTVYPVSDVLFDGSGHHFRNSDAQDSKEQRKHDDLVSLIDPVLSMEEFGVKISNVRGSSWIDAVSGGPEPSPWR